MSLADAGAGGDPCPLGAGIPLPGPLRRPARETRTLPASPTRGTGCSSTSTGCCRPPAPGARLLDLGLRHRPPPPLGAGTAATTVAGTDGSEAMLAEARRLNPSSDLQPRAGRRAAVSGGVVRRGPLHRGPAVPAGHRPLPPRDGASPQAGRRLPRDGLAPPQPQRLPAPESPVALRVPALRTVRLKQFFHTSWGLERPIPAGGLPRTSASTASTSVSATGSSASRPRSLPGFLRAFERSRRCDVGPPAPSGPERDAARACDPLRPGSGPRSRSAPQPRASSRSASTSSCSGAPSTSSARRGSAGPARSNGRS